MDQKGLVTKINGSMAEVEVKRVSACGDSCENCSGSCDIPGVKVNILNTINAKPGDYVEIRGKSRGLIKYTIILYMIPLMMLLLGMFSGIYFFKYIGNKNYETLGFIVGLIFLSISYIFLKRIDKKVSAGEGLTFEMVRKL